MDLVSGGIIVSTHGVRGTVKIEPWTDTPEFLCAVPRLFIEGRGYAVLGASVHKSHVLATLEGVGTVQDASALCGRIVSFMKADVNLSGGEHFIDDLIGLDAVDDDTGKRLGTITDFLSLPSNGVYVIKTAGRDDMLIPAVSQFVRKIDVENGCVRFFVMEGL